MLQIIENLPPHVIGVRATGHVTKEEIETVIIPLVDKQVEKYDKLNYILLLETEIYNWDFSAIVKDLAKGFKHYMRWRKIAMVSDQVGLNAFVASVSVFMPGEIQGFTLSQFEEAKRWVAEIK